MNSDALNSQAINAPPGTSAADAGDTGTPAPAPGGSAGGTSAGGSAGLNGGPLNSAPLNGAPTTTDSGTGTNPGTPGGGDTGGGTTPGTPGGGTQPVYDFEPGPVITPGAGQPVGVGPVARWSLRVVVRGVDLSARLVGTCTVSADESSARVAELSLVPLEAQVQPLQWLGAPIQIYSVHELGDGRTVEVKRFGGVVASPDWDPRAGVLNLTASDTLKSRLEAMTVTAIDQLVGGDWLEEISGEIESHWTYAQQRLETVPAALDMSVDGTLRVTPWQPSATPAYRFGPDAVIDDSLQIDLMSIESLFNRVILTVEYRYQRLRERTHSFSWSHPSGGFCQWIRKTTDLPTVSMVTEAVDGSGWKLLGRVGGTMLPASNSMQNLCPGGGAGAWINNYTGDPFLLGATATVVRRVGQPVTETYEIIVECPASVEALGEQILRDNLSAESEFDVGPWEAMDAAANAEDYKAGTIPPLGATGWGTQEKGGDRILNKDDEALRAGLLRTAYAQAATKIIGSHRATRATFRTPVPSSDLDLVHTVSATANGCTAAGKVAALAFSWDLDTGEDIVEISLAISAGYGSTTTPYAQTPRPAITGLPGYPTGTGLQTQLHDPSNTGAQAYNEKLDGYSGNYSSVIYGSTTVESTVQGSNGTNSAGTTTSSKTNAWGSETTTTTTTDANGNTVTTTSRQESAAMSVSGGDGFPRRFQVTTPDIAAAFTDELKPKTSGRFEVATRGDVLTLEAIP